MKDSVHRHDITELLGAIRRGKSDSGGSRASRRSQDVQDPQDAQLAQDSQDAQDARDALFDRIYGEFRHLASGQLRGERNETLAPTDLVQETCLRLLSIELRAEDRRQLFSLASTVMRRVLVDRARRRNSQKRGASAQRCDAPLDGLAAPSNTLILDLDLAFARLREQRPELAEVVSLRFHVGLGVEQTAKVLGLSTATIKRRWRLARAWLWREISDSSAPSEAAGVPDAADKTRRSPPSG